MTAYSFPGNLTGVKGPLRLSLLLLLLGLLPGCGASEYDDDFEGVMSDRSWGNQVQAGQRTVRPNALGQPVSVDQFEGRFLWADYAAPWCEPCRRQAGELRRLEQRWGEEVVFLTVMTSASSTGRKDAVPTVDDARSWATSHNLPPEGVVAADNLWGMTIPTHILYSPQGQSLYRSSGFLPAETISGILEQRMAEWREWERTGRTADWMR